MCLFYVIFVALSLVWGWTIILFRSHEKNHLCLKCFKDCLSSESILGRLSFAVILHTLFSFIMLSARHFWNWKCAGCVILFSWCELFYVVRRQVKWPIFASSDLLGLSICSRMTWIDWIRVLLLYRLCCFRIQRKFYHQSGKSYAYPILWSAK